MKPNLIIFSEAARINFLESLIQALINLFLFSMGIGSLNDHMYLEMKKNIYGHLKS